MDSVRFRRFNRFYTNILGLLSHRYLRPDVTLAQARVLFEIGATPGGTAAELSDRISMDRGQLSRLLDRLETLGWVSRQTKARDRRAAALYLTTKGKAVLAELEQLSEAQAENLLARLPGGAARRSLGQAMTLMETLLGETPGVPVIRPGQPGDLGWVLARHAEYYGQEYGFDASFEGYVLDGMAAYVRQVQDRHGLIMAELDGLPVGSLALVESENGWGQLRWFYVEPWIQGRGVGRRLLKAALDRAEERGLPGVFLWTFAALEPARRLYLSMGLECIERRSGSLGGQTVDEERWEKKME